MRSNKEKNHKLLNKQFFVPQRKVQLEATLNFNIKGDEIVIPTRVIVGSTPNFSKFKILSLSLTVFCRKK